MLKFVVLKDSSIKTDEGEIYVKDVVKKVSDKESLEEYNILGYSFSSLRTLPKQKIVEVKDLGRKIVTLYSFYNYNGDRNQITLPDNREYGSILVYAPFFMDKVYLQEILKKEESFSEVCEITLAPNDGKTILDGIFSNEGLIFHDTRNYDKLSVWKKLS